MQKKLKDHPPSPFVFNRAFQTDPKMQKKFLKNAENLKKVIGSFYAAARLSTTC